MKNKQITIGLASLVIIALMGAGIWTFLGSSGSLTSSQSVETAELTTTALSNGNVQIDGNEADGIEWDALPTTEIALSNEVTAITEAGTYILSGESSAGVVVNSEGNVRLALNGVNIVSSDSAAISVESADNAVIHLVDGSENYLEDAATRSNQEIDGALFSADDLLFTGTGKLSVKSNFEDGIVSNDDLTIFNGTIVVDSMDEGIRGRDSVEIVDGVVTVDADDDGIRASNDADLEKGYIHITGGDITVAAADDGIKAVTSIIIDGGNVVVTESLEGMEATNITINNGTVDVTATDDGINAVSDGLGGDVFITIAGGTVNVTAEGQDSDGLDANGALTISGGTTTITVLASEPASPTDYDTTATFSGGTLIIDGVEVSEIPEPFGHAGGGGGGPTQLR